MKSALMLSVVPATLFASAMLAATPALAAGADERAVAQCRTELMSRFDQGAIRSYRVGAIAGNSRRTRVTIYVNADRRYTFECAAGADGQVTATLNPPVDTRLAGAVPPASQAQ